MTENELWQACLLLKIAASVKSTTAGAWHRPFQLNSPPARRLSKRPLDTPRSLLIKISRLPRSPPGPEIKTPASQSGPRPRGPSGIASARESDLGLSARPGSKVCDWQTAGLASHRPILGPDQLGSIISHRKHGLGAVESISSFAPLASTSGLVLLVSGKGCVGAADIDEDIRARGCPKRYHHGQRRTGLESFNGLPPLKNVFLTNRNQASGLVILPPPG